MEHDGITPIASFARTAKASPDCVDRFRTQDQRAGALVVDCQGDVDDLHELGCTHCAVRGGWHKSEPEHVAVVIRTLTVKIQHAGHARQRSSKLLRHQVRVSACNRRGRRARYMSLLLGAPSLNPSTCKSS